MANWRMDASGNWVLDNSVDGTQSRGSPPVSTTDTGSSGSVRPGFVSATPSPDPGGSVRATPPPAAPPPAATQPGRPGFVPASPPPAAPPPPSASPPPAAPPPPSAALLSQPGAYEEWIKTHAGALDTPTNAEAIYTGTKPTSALSQVSDLAPGMYQQGAQGYVDALSGQGAAETLGSTAAEDLGGTLPTGGSNATGVYGQASGALSGSGAMEQFYGAHGADPLQTGYTENFANTNKDLSDAGAMEALYASHGADPWQTGASENFAANNHDIDTGAMEQFVKQYGTDPMQKGYTENLYESGIGQLDPYYDYASKRAIQGAQTASAARGGFNSGLAAQQEGDILGNLRGQQASKWVDLAPIADQAKLDREKLGGDWAHTSESDAINRYGALSDAMAKSDAAKLGRQTLGFDAARSAQDSEQNRYKLQESTATDADSAKLGRETLAGNLANDAQTQEQNRYRTLSDVASAGDAADLGRTNARITADRNASDAALARSKQAEDALINRTKTSADISQSAEDQALQEWMANSGLAQSKDQMSLSLQQEQDRQAAAADTAARNRLLDQGNLMQDLQTTGQNRLAGGLNATSNVSQQEADLVRQFYANIDLSQYDATQLQAEANKWGMTAQEFSDVMGFKTSVAGLVTGKGK